MTSEAETMRREIAEGLQVGLRASCSPGERALGRVLEGRFGAFCDSVRAEPFQCQPHAFLGFIPFVSALTLVALWWLPSAPLWAALLGAVSTVVTVAELLLYVELVDRFFPTREGVNIVGRIQPTGPVQRRVILSAHQDSAFEFNLWYWFKTAGVPLNVLGLGAPLLALIGGGLAALGVIEAEGLAWWARALMLPAALHLVFHTFRVVPGAMDDLAGLSVVTAAGRHFAAQRLAGTEVVLLGCAAEECGLRGAKRFVSAHADELRAVPTQVINIDGVYDEQFLTVVTRELTTGVRHDPALVALAQQCAERPIQTGMIPFGATDASAFGQAGIRTVALLCQDIVRLAPNYHTRLDTLDRVRPESLSVMRNLVVEMVRRIDRGEAG